MSLFNSREWWSTRLGAGEEFDGGCLCVANIDNNPSGTLKIVTGSLQGVLRVHQPRQRGFHVEDVLLEAELEGSILQLAAGSFLGGSSSSCLAVLHPHKLAVYSLQSVGSSFLQLAKQYEHALKQPAANMTTGQFGGTLGATHIAVQSYDGVLNCFEGEAATFAVGLPSFLLPGPLAYVEATDSFVTCNAAMELTAFKFSVLAAASEKHEAAAQPGLEGADGGKRVHPDWQVVLGELALDIRTGRVTEGARPDAAPDLLVLCEHTFFVANLRGQLLLQRRLDFHPAACCPFPAGGAPGGGPVEHLLVATHTRALLVYRGCQLAWAARLELLPVAVAVAELGGTQGLVVALDDTGKLAVLYLGSEPPQHAVSLAQPRQQLDYAGMEAERRALLAQIKAAGTDGLAAAAAAAAGNGGGRKGRAAASGGQPLQLQARVPSRAEAPEQVLGPDGVPAGAGMPGGGSGGVQQLTVTLLLANASREPLQDVSLSVLAPAPVQVVTQQQQFIQELPPLQPGNASSRDAAGAADADSRPRGPLAVSVVLQVPAIGGGGCDGVPAANTAQVVATYKTQQGQRLVVQLAFRLPMCMFCQVIPPVKDGTYKITLATNRPPVQLAALFSDMLVQASPAHAEALSRAQAANVLSFRFASSGSTASILVSKAGGRYRLQADCFGALWLVLQELATRLGAHFVGGSSRGGGAAAAAAGAAGAGGAAAAAADGGVGGGGASSAEEPFAITYEEALPLQDVFELVDAHFGARQALAAAEAELEQREVQFRAIQKRLLMRYKDKNAAPLNQLDVLLEETYEQLMALAQQVEDAQAQLQAAGHALAAGVQLLLLLARYRFGLSEPEFELLRACLCQTVLETVEVSWQELVEAAATQLLRTSLARSAKDAAASVPPLAPAPDTARVKRHVSLVLERLAKGMRLLPDAAAANGGSAGAAHAAGPR